MSKQSVHLKEYWSCFPASTSIHSLMLNGILVLREDDMGKDVCFGLALAAGFRAHAKLALSRFSCFSSGISVTYLSNPVQIVIHRSIESRL